MKLGKLIWVIERKILRFVSLLDGNLYKRIYPQYLKRIGINIPNDYYEGGEALLTQLPILMVVIIV